MGHLEGKRSSRMRIWIPFSSSATLVCSQISSLPGVPQALLSGKLPPRGSSRNFGVRWSSSLFHSRRLASPPSSVARGGIHDEETWGFRTEGGEYFFCARAYRYCCDTVGVTTLHCYPRYQTVLLLSRRSYKFVYFVSIPPRPQPSP